MVHVTKADALLVPSARDTPMAQLQRQLIGFDSFGAHTILKTTAAITSVPGKKWFGLSMAKGCRRRQGTHPSFMQVLDHHSYHSFLMMYLLVCQFDE